MSRVEARRDSLVAAKERVLIPLPGDVYLDCTRLMRLRSEYDNGSVESGDVPLGDLVVRTSMQGPAFVRDHINGMISRCHEERRNIEISLELMERMVATYKRRLREMAV